MYMVPTGVKVISILYYIGAAFLAIGGLISILGGGLISSLLSDIPGLGLIGGAFFVILGIFFIAIGVLYFFIGRGLWKAQSWARIVAIIFATLGVLGSIFSLFSGSLFSIVWLIIYGFILWYLAFSEEVKKAFK